MNIPGAPSGNSGWVERRAVSDKLKESAGLHAAHTRHFNTAHTGAWETKEKYRSGSSNNKPVTADQPLKHP